MPEQLTGWNRIELARLYGCLHIRYIRMRDELNRNDDNIISLNEYQGIRDGLARLKEAKGQS